MSQPSPPSHSPLTNMVSKNNLFMDWFRGFIDSEGYFGINWNGPNGFVFEFAIELHLDDLPCLLDIQANLSELLGLDSATEVIGAVSEKSKGKTAAFRVTKQEHLVKLLGLLAKYPINSKKYLYLLSFKRAFELYLSYKDKSNHILISTINEIKGGMNKARTDFNMPSDFSFSITPGWLLGFIEGDGSFFIRERYTQLDFNLGQSGRDEALLNEIRDFLLSLPSGDKIETLKVRVNKTVDKRFHRTLLELIIDQQDAINNVIIPFLLN